MSVLNNKFLSLSNSSKNLDSNSFKEEKNSQYAKILSDLEDGNLQKYDKNLKSYPKLKNSKFFDANYYISKYNLNISENYALIHYLSTGFKENKNPSEEFNGNKYLQMNPDVKRAGYNPLVHYELYGKKEGRQFPLSEFKELSSEISSLKSIMYQNRVVQNLSLLRDKVSKGKKVNVIFVLPAMMFVYTDLYNLFDNDDLFNVQIVLVPHRLGNSSEITDVAKEKYFQIFNYLNEKNFNVILGFDFDKNQGIDLVTICNPDILFYVSPHMRIYPKSMKIDNLPVNILYPYIPYGEFIENNLSDFLYNFGWNERIWKVFCSTEEYLQGAASKSVVGSSNVMLAGSARMDALINFKESDGDYEWIYNKAENKKRIIWAPHHSLSRPGMDDSTAYSTFDDNYEFFYNYAKNHPNTEWVVRPHPLLKEVLSKINTNMKVKGLVDENFVDEYFFKWESLPNARVHEDIDYYDLFATADAMITDCVSFRSEYLFTNKPGLILKRPNIKFDDYGNKILKAWYIENGSDFEQIEKFIEDVVVGENDYLKDQREQVFNENFNVNLGNASNVIFNFIKNELI